MIQNKTHDSVEAYTYLKQTGVVQPALVKEIRM